MMSFRRSGISALINLHCRANRSLYGFHMRSVSPVLPLIRALSRFSFRRHGTDPTRPLHPDPILDLVAEMPDQPLHRPGRRLAERADRVAFHLLGDIEQGVDLLDLCLAPHQPVHYPHHPASALTAGRALPAALMLVEG